jgi:hypothetical protein
MSVKMNRKDYDFLVIGGGVFGMYAARAAAASGKKTALIEQNTIFSKASFVNQARVHRGYHYPRAHSTALASANYYHRFTEEFSAAIVRIPENYYAIPYSLTKTDAVLFEEFCDGLKIPCERIYPDIFDWRTVDKAYRVEEVAFDAHALKEILISPDVDYFENEEVIDFVVNAGCDVNVTTNMGGIFNSSEVFIAAYAATNRILNMLKRPCLDLKYELCEVALYRPKADLSKFGLTIMDGPFASFMPWDSHGHYSLTNVSYTPHEESRGSVPSFSCHEAVPLCGIESRYNCNDCASRPKSKHRLLESSLNRYLSVKIANNFQYVRSVYGVKTILDRSEVLDDRPTLLRSINEEPRITICFSGKIDTVFDIDEFLF